MSQHHTHKAHIGSGNWELLYKRPYEGKGVAAESSEFIIRIDDIKLLEQWKGAPSTVPIIEIVDVPEVFVTEYGRHTGRLARPSNEQLLDAFGSFKFDDIFAFMVEHGHIQNAGGHASLREHKQPEQNW